MNPLSTSIEYLKGIGPHRAEILKKELKIRTYQDLLFLFPNRYIDKTVFHKIIDLNQENSEVQLKGKIIDIKIISQKIGKRLIAKFQDDTGEIDLIWFRGHKWISKKTIINTKYVIFGRLNWFLNKPGINHPEITLESSFIKENQLNIHPVYPSTEKLIAKGISQKIIKNAVKNLFDKIGNNFSETLPEYLINKLNLISKSDAICQIHFPKKNKQIIDSIKRLKFEELFFLQLQLLRKNMNHKLKVKGFFFNNVGKLLNTFYKKHLPFSLTNDQKKAIKEIRNDMGTGKHMNRLLQGDVGSGKTIVAFFSILIALDNGYQACLMAPTEILAKQHFQSLSVFSNKMNLSISLLTGSSKNNERKIINDGIINGSINILIGTHALIEDKIIFKNLGLAIIDEQHRFGVAQRSKLWKKNLIPPHILIMTATPIPRTLAMTVYGDLDLSLIKELPPGRKEIKTYLKNDSKRLEVFKFISKEINLGRQIYIVYPLIEESQKLDYKDLMDGYESICRYFPLPDYRISILHGKMKSKVKDHEMNRFIKGETQIMVATTVIEVGVDIPNASVIVIESAEKFGLSQLHQLRGRVGRGNFQSHCILMCSYKTSKEAQTRLNAMVKSNNGFEIADVDLKLRGPGNLMGTQQSGLLKLKIADILKDQKLLINARKYANKILIDDPGLNKNINLNIKKAISIRNKEKNLWNYIS